MRTDDEAIKEAKREYYRQYRKKNADKLRAYAAEYRAAHKEECRAAAKKWRAANKDKVQAINRRYWLKKAGAGKAPQ